jgi:GNAT superfamily N-acetyltransferase
MISISIEDPRSKDAIILIDELSAELECITGNSGKGSFNIDDVCVEKAMFVIARNVKGEAIGCGSFRPINKDVAEIKRMYAKHKGKGIGKQILKYLEEQAKKLGYARLWLETRIVNEQAVSFYKYNGYLRIQNYGKYVDKSEAICFEKIL